MNQDASFRAAVDADSLAPPGGAATDADRPLPVSLYRTVNGRAWLAVVAAGLLGWFLLLKLL